MSTDLTPDQMDRMAERRRDLITGLRDLADFLETNPDLPIGYTAAEVTYFPSAGDDDAARAEVDRIAALIGAVPQIRADGDHYRVVKEFGPAVYEVVAVTSDCMARYQALHSYTGSVTPDPAPAPAVPGAVNNDFGEANAA